MVIRYSLQLINSKHTHTREHYTGSHVYDTMYNYHNIKVKLIVYLLYKDNSVRHPITQYTCKQYHESESNRKEVFAFRSRVSDAAEIREVGDAVDVVAPRTEVGLGVGQEVEDE